MFTSYITCAGRENCQVLDGGDDSTPSQNLKSQTWSQLWLAVSRVCVEGCQSRFESDLSSGSLTIQVLCFVTADQNQAKFLERLYTVMTVLPVKNVISGSRHKLG